jgi:hypothetical protein
MSVDDDAFEQYYLAYYLAYYFHPQLIPSERNLLWACHVSRLAGEDSERRERLVRKAGCSEEAMQEVAERDLENTIREVSEAALQREGSNIFINRCPKCHRLARTPRAKQCQWCYHSWRTTGE